jgi:hypothetical protein
MKKETGLEFARRMIEARRFRSESVQQRILEENRQAAEPVVRELRALGFNVDTIAQLRHLAKSYESAIPTLVKWLPLIDNPDAKNDIARNLSLKSQKHLAPLFVDEYRRSMSHTTEPYEALRQALANGLEIFADDSLFVEVSNLLTQSTAYEPNHVFLTLALGKMRTPAAVDLLVALLPDPRLTHAAITSLGKLKVERARPHIAPFLDGDDRQIAAAARKAIAALDRPRKS